MVGHHKGTEMVHSVSAVRLGKVAVCVATSSLALAACSKKDAAPAADTNVASTDIAATNATVVAPAAPAATSAPAADNTDTVSGVKLASYTGDAAAGKTAFITCQTCHAIEVGVNRIGPSLHGVVGRKAGSVAGFAYSTANSGSGITWTPEKLFQYLENAQRVVPGTKMSFASLPDPQKRADVIAYLKTNS